MRKMVLKTTGMLACLCLLAGATGCAIMDQMVKTQTSDGDAKMTQLGDYSGPRFTVACKKFENQAGWSGSWDLGQNLSIMLESALYDTGRFSVLERKDLGDVIGEQDLAASGRAAKTENAKIGKLKTARFLASGAVTTAEEGTSGGLGGLSFKGVSLGGGKSSAQVTIIAKLTDTTTGELVAKKTIIGKAGRVNMSVGLSVKGVSTDLGGFRKTPMGEAAQDCINQAAIFFAKEIERLPKE